MQDKTENKVCGTCKGNGVLRDTKQFDGTGVKSCPECGSGQKQMDRFNEGKPRLSYCPGFAVEVIATTLYTCSEEAGGEYKRGNWRKGGKWTIIAESLMRHLYAFLEGEDDDKKSKLPHVYHILVNAVFLAWSFVNFKQYDDREKVPE